METTTQNSRKFEWVTNVEISTTPHHKGDRMSLSDAEIIVDALAAHRTQAFQDLETAFASMLQNANDPERIKACLTSDCRRALEVIKTCSLFQNMIAGEGLCNTRVVSGQYPDLVDKQ